MANVAGNHEADSGTGGSTVADSGEAPEEDVDRNDTEKVTGSSVNYDFGDGSLRCDRCDNFEAPNQTALTVHMAQCQTNTTAENEVEVENNNPPPDRLHRKMFECDVCNMKFSNGANMRRHKMRHTGVKPYECRVCQKRFFRKDHLAEHFTTHTKTLPYHCPICNRGFQRQIAMRAHFQNEHVGQHDLVKSCPLCSYRAGSMKSLRVHFFNRHGIDLDNPGPAGSSASLLAAAGHMSMDSALSTLGSLSVSVTANYSDSGDSTGARSADNATPPMHFLTPHVEISMADAPASFSPVQLKKKKINMETKFHIIQEFESGASIVKLAEKYNVHHSSISRIISKKDILKEQLNTILVEGGTLKQTRCSESRDSKLEKCLMFWVTQKRSLGEPISGVNLREKALQFHMQLDPETVFKASDGWLMRFKDRHGIRYSSMESADVFKKSLNMLMEAHGYNRDNVYNADETGLEYRMLPQRTLPLGTEKQVKQRVTLLVCANASGTHKVPLLMIGNAVPPCFINVNEPPIHYREQEKAWMDRNLLMDWFKNIFIPSVKSVKPGSNEKYMLIIDNAPSHPPVEELNAIDKNVHVFYVPPNVTALMQPMNQCVISALKHKYREILLRQLIDKKIENSLEVTKFLSSWSILNCCYALFTAWEKVTPSTLKNAWKHLLDVPDATNVTEESSINDNAWKHLLDVPNATDVTEDSSIHDLLNDLPGGITYTVEQSINWVNSDNNISTCREMSDAEILYHCAGLNIPVKNTLPDDGSALVKNEETSDNEDCSAPVRNEETSDNEDCSALVKNEETSDNEDCSAPVKNEETSDNEDCSAPVKNKETSDNEDCSALVKNEETSDNEDSSALVKNEETSDNEDCIALVKTEETSDNEDCSAPFEPSKSHVIDAFDTVIVWSRSQKNDIDPKITQMLLKMRYDVLLQDQKE